MSTTGAPWGRGETGLKEKERMEEPSPAPGRALVSRMKDSTRPSGDGRRESVRGSLEIRRGPEEKHHVPCEGPSSWLTLFSGLWNMSSKILIGVTLFRSRF